MDMNVTQAILSRKSVRAYTNKTIDESEIIALLEKASRSPSGGNLQPWRIFTLDSQRMKHFLEFQKNYLDEHVPDYSIYPDDLSEPYNTSRKLVGEMMYSLLNISREDKDARIQQVLKNFTFFDAPSALFCFIDKCMGPPQWSDLGMFLQSFMLLAQEKGLSTCAQEAWSLRAKMVRSYFGISDSFILFCGTSIGYEDTSHPINQLKTQRQPLSEWVNPSFIDERLNNDN